MTTEHWTLLDELRAQSQVDCDTLDEEVARTLGPFVDCTSNQAIAYGEAQKPGNQQVLLESAKLARRLHEDHAANVNLEQLAVEIMMVLLSSKMTPYLTGRAHVQTNPYHAYSVEQTVANAKRIIAIYKTVRPDFESSRICIKIPSTWEGIQACRQLERQSIYTLATTLFSMEQATLAADAGCTYIAPYVNELKAHFVPGYVDTNKGFSLVRTAQAHYARTSATTQVLPASLTSVAEVMQLAGAHHITISPPLLAELAATPAAAPSLVAKKLWMDAAGDGANAGADAVYASLVADEAAYRMAFTRSAGGENERKLSDAINIFADMQDAMEALVRPLLYT